MVNCEHCKREMEETEERFLNWLCSDCAKEVEASLKRFEEEQATIMWENAARAGESINRVVTSMLGRKNA